MEETSMKRPVYIALLVVFVMIFLVSATCIMLYVLDSIQQRDMYNDLASLVGTNDGADSPTEPIQIQLPVFDSSTGEDVETTDTVLEEYAALYLKNSDMVGWIKIEDTNINYPVMQTPDRKDYYLKRDFNGEDNKHGCIYVRESCDVFTPSDNITIYGHCMYDGSMFNNLHKYKTKSFWEEHRYITFDTLTEHHTYEIFAVFKTTATLGKGFAYHRFENAANEEEFMNFVNKCVSLSFYKTGVEVAYGDKLICLSTCEYTQTNGRLVVVAKRIS